MPSFDIVSEVDNHEIANAVDQANREIDNRFDFKGVTATIEYESKANEITISTESDFQLQQLSDILENRLIKRNIDPQSLDYQEATVNVQTAKQVAKVKQGIDKDAAKKIIKRIKDQKFKVQTAIQGEQIRVTGKKRDDLQTTMAFLKEQELDIPVQFNNFRD
ncbi:MAG: YajQ family cyclic di-GMP-binding protein [Gammaproteobacteria bacterium]|nr:YajQ family cyclic di-GMP-binding protein [Gammaproteobacteria bacterium]